jgi:hypothetical protein
LRLCGSGMLVGGKRRAVGVVHGKFITNNIVGIRSNTASHSIDTRIMQRFDLKSAPLCEVLRKQVRLIKMFAAIGFL